MIELEPCSLDAPKNATYSFQKGHLECGHPVVVFQLAGKAANSPEYDDVYTYAPAWIVAGLEAWQPAGIVLDLRRLEYEYGDMMTNVISAPDSWYVSARPGREVAYLMSCGRSAPGEFPVGIVVSDLCRPGITSLLSELMNKDPAVLLHDTLENAIAALERKLEGWKPF